METLLLSLIVGLLGLIVVSLWAVLFQLVKQQGRILLHLDGLENRQGPGGWPASNGVPMAQPSQPEGLPVGTEIAPFRLDDLGGHQVASEDFRGRRLLLINWSPQCGYCDLVAPELAKLQAGLKAHDVQVLLIAHGGAQANRRLAEEHKLEVPILMLGEGKKTPEFFENLGTPVAYLVDDRGRVERPLALGSDGVLDLARVAVGDKPGKGRKRLPGERPLKTSRLVRDGLKAGTPAPPFALPDIRGGTVSLEDYRGRRVLLVFSDPHCGPCDQLAPDLVRMHEQEQAGGPAVIVIGRGDLEENRRKAETHGFTFPVLIQKRWELSKEYGIFATPVAFLIDERGIISRDVAQGVEAIRELVPADLAVVRRPRGGR